MNGMPERNLIRGVAALLLLLSCVAAVSAGIPGDLNGDDRLSDEELSRAIIGYMRAAYCGENVIHLSSGQLAEAARFYEYGTYPPEDDTVLRIGTPNIVKSPSLVGDYYTGIFAHLSNLPLMQMGADGHLFGQSAERYEVSDDSRVWTFYLKDDLYWSDGMRVTPGDVAFTFNYIGKKVPSAGWIGDTLVSTAVNNEENAVILTFNKPYTQLNLEFATYNLLPEHIWQEIEDPAEYTSTGPYVGCGPYYLDEINLDSARLIFKKNPHWKGKQPAFGAIEVHWYGTPNVACSELMNGQVDTYYQYAKSYPYANVVMLDPADFSIVESPSIGLTFIGLNLKSGPTADVKFREAISYAINYPELVTIDTLGYGQVPNRGFVPPGMDSYKETTPLRYDVAKAKELLAAANYTDTNGNGIVERDGDGEDIVLDLLIRTGYEDDARLLKEYLEAAGIGADIRLVDQATWFALKDNYEYDLTITGTTPWGMLMHAGWGTGYFDSRRTGQGVLHNLDDPVFLQLCNDILATTNQAQLNKLGSDVQDYYATQVPAIPLYWKRDVTPYNRAFTGWHSNPLFGIYALDTFLDVRPIAG